MKSTIGWILGIVLVLLLVLPALFIMGRFWSGGYGGMMGGYGGMMGGFGHMGIFGFFGMALMWLIPLGLLVLVVVGVVALVNGLTRSGNTAAPLPARNCPSCGKPAQSDWATCPYCGTALK